MKAVIDLNDGPFIIRLVPETVEEGAVLQMLSRRMNRSHMINSRGFGYMTPDVEFYVQPMPQGD